PRQPVDRVVPVLEQVRGALVRQRVGHQRRLGRRSMLRSDGSPASTALRTDVTIRRPPSRPRTAPDDETWIRPCTARRPPTVTVPAPRSVTLPLTETPGR